jgi:hypothetical protein
MKLVTFQTMYALKELLNKEYLECKEEYVDLKKSEHTYNWVLGKMNEKIQNNYKTKYPLWAWIKFKNGICPPKHKGNRVKGFDVKITFNKPENEVFVMDYRKFSFLLNNIYIPDSKNDKELFDKELKNKNITLEELKAFIISDKFKLQKEDEGFLEVCKKIEKSFEKCITKDSDVLQGCIWRLNLEDVEKIEILRDTNYIYGSFNYLRSNGKRFDWQEDFYKSLK